MGRISFVCLGYRRVNLRLGHGLLSNLCLPPLLQLLLIRSEVFSRLLVGCNDSGLPAEADVIIRTGEVEHIIGAESDGNQGSCNQQSLWLEYTKWKHQQQRTETIAEKNIPMPEESPMKQTQRT